MPEEQINQTQQEIKETLQTVKQQAVEVKDELVTARKVVRSVNELNTRFEDIKQKLLNEGTGIEATLNTLQTSKQRVDEIKQSSETNLNKIETTLQSIQKHIAEMESTYQQFLTVKTKVEDGESGLQAILTKSKQTKEQIDALKASSDQYVSQIKNNLEVVQSNIKTMTDAYSLFQETKAKIDDKGTGLEAILIQSKQLQQEIEAVKNLANKVHTQIQEFRDQSQNMVKDITDLHGSAKQKTDDIIGLNRDSEEYNKKIEKIYQLATDHTLAGSFNNRKKELFYFSLAWFVVLILSVISLFFAIKWVHDEAIKNGQITITSIFWYRLTMTSPLIFLAGFAAAQYTKERNLHEKYAFKAATALALESYTSLLKRIFVDQASEIKILDFVLNSMKTIYKEPYEPTHETKFKIGIGNKFLEIKAEITDKVEELIEKSVDFLKGENIEDSTNKKTK